MIFIVFLTFPRRKIFHYSDAQDRYTENEFIRKGDDGSRKTQEEKLKPTTYTDDNGNQEYIYVEKI